jgi:hypothetical protein
MFHAIAIALTLTQLTPKGATLNGTVKDASGQTLPKATVFIRTAGPRKGVGVL